MNFKTHTLLLIIVSLAASAADTPFQSREPLPWNLLENGGFEHDSTGLFAVGLAQRDRENPATGDACGRFDIAPGKNALDVRISNGLRLEKGKDYIVTGRMRTALLSKDAEASVVVSMLGANGQPFSTLLPLRLTGTENWHSFIQRVRGDGTSSLRLALAVKGMPNDRVWLDDLFVGPAEVDLSWQSAPGSGLLQAAVADGVQFEFQIPTEAHILAVFRNGKRLRETVEFETLPSARVVRFFETPAHGDSLAFVLTSALARAQLPVSPLHRYGIYSKAGKVDAWIPDALPEFKAPELDFAALEREAIELPSIDGLPTEWRSDSPRDIRLQVHAPGHYSLRMRDGAGHVVADLAEHIPLPHDGILQTSFSGCDNAGTPLPAGKYTWDVVHRPMNAFVRRLSADVDVKVKEIWRSRDGLMLLVQQKVDGKPAFVVMSTDDTFKPIDRKAVLFAKDIDNFVEASPGVYFFRDRETNQICKFEKDKATVFPKATDVIVKGQHVALAPYATPAGPGLFIARYWDDRSLNATAPGPAVLKLDANGDAVAAFGEGGRVGAPILEAPAALEPLEDGSVLVVDSRSGAWLKQIGANGVAQKVWNGPRGGPLQESSAIEDSEEAYTLLRTQADILNQNIDTRFRTVNRLLHAPSGEILVAPGYEHEPPREVQMYSSRGDFISSFGRGPQTLTAPYAYDYAHNWDVRGNNSFYGIQSVFLDANGDLVIFDRRRFHVERWGLAARVSNLSVEIKDAAKQNAAAADTLNLLPAAFSLETLKQRHGLTAHVADVVNLAQSGVGQGLRDDGTSSVISKPNLHAYRLSGTEHGSWFRTRLQISNPGRPHLLVVEYPDDAHRWTALAVRHDGEWTTDGVTNSLGAEGGYGTGWAQPLTGKDQYYSMLVTPRRSTLTLYFMSFLHSGLKGIQGIPPNAPVGPLYGAAASRVWLLEIDAPLPPNPVEEPLAGVRRSIGEHSQNMAAVFSDFGGPAQANPQRRSVAYQQKEWTRQTYTNFFTFNTWLGFNAFDSTLMDESSNRLYPSSVFKNGRAEHEDVARWVLASSQNLGTDISFTFAGLVGIPADHPELANKQLYTENGTADARNLSLVYPEVQQYFRDLVLELAKRSKDAPQFKGVTLALFKNHAPLFGSSMGLEAGFEEASLKAFEAVHGAPVPGETLQAKVAVLKTSLREDVSAWRCALFQKWVLSLRDELKKVRPDLQLALDSHAGPDARFYGFDRTLFKNQENIRIVETSAESGTFPELMGDSLAKWKDLKPETPVDVLEVSSGDFDIRAPWAGETSAVLMPNKNAILAPLVAAFVRKNPRSIFLESDARSTLGCELELREFARAVRSLPFAPAEELKDAVSGLKVYRYGGNGAVQYLAVVNPSVLDVTAKVNVADAPAGESVRDLVGGRDVPAAKNAQGVSFEAVVPAGNMRTYRLGK